MRHLLRGASLVLPRENRESEVAHARAWKHGSIPEDLEGVSDGGEAEADRIVERRVSSYVSAMADSHLGRPSYRGMAEAVAVPSRIEGTKTVA